MIRRLLQKRLRVALLLLALPILSWGVLWGLACVVPLPPGFFAPGSTVVAFADGSFGHVFLSPDEKWRIAVDLDEIEPAYLSALIRLEDKRFYDHPGVDIRAIARAGLLNLMERRVVSGASTLTMQLVRVREPRPRTIGSKIVEAWRALQLEARYDKKEILEAYLQYVPYGRNVEGVEAAALSYFGHRATSLSATEIATLLAVPQNPNRRYPHPRNARRLKAARDQIATRLADWDVLPLGQKGAQITAQEALRQVQTSAVPARLDRFPRILPHAAAWLTKRYPGRLRLNTTLDRGVQRLAEQTLEDARREARANGVFNGAIVVVEHKPNVVRGLVGSFDFWDEEHGGQIVGFANPRSPGSALKPFIYALGIDRGLVLPEFLVLDVPTSFGNYAPKNYDGTFSGLVQMEDALSRSLNVPFVNLLGRIGIDHFVGHLRTWNVSSLRDEPGFYGLSAAIGGLELTPLELAGLYAMLANDGVHRPLVLLLEDLERAKTGGRALPVRDARSGIEALSPGAAFLTRRALRLKDRPDFPARKRFTGIPPHIHWKTGTSYGHRDAWAIGSGSVYTGAVWLGNFDNQPSVHLVGASAAGPILFDLLEGLTSKEGPTDAAPRDLKQIEVCSYSGRPVGSGCSQKKTIWAKRRNVPTETCPYHVELDVETTTGLALAPQCRAGRDYTSRNFVVWPAGLRRFLAEEHRRMPQPPSFAPGCGGVASRAPAIVSPPSNHVALLVPGMPATAQEIPLTADSSGRQLSWFVNGEFLGTVASDVQLWWTPEVGRNEIVVTDEAGRSAKRSFRVTASARPF